LAEQRSATAATQALGLLREQFRNRQGIGVQMTVRAIGSLDDPARITASCTALAEELLDTLEA
jgi:hypothetical protein